MQKEIQKKFLTMYLMQMNRQEFLSRQLLCIKMQKIICLKGQHFIQYGGNKKRENTT